MLCNPPSLRAGICCDLPPAPACVRWEQGPYPDHSGHCITQFNGWMFVQHSVSHITGCTADHTVQLPQMIVERCIVVENHSGACIQMRLTNASSSCAGHHTLFQTFIQVKILLYIGTILLLCGNHKGRSKQRCVIPP